MKLLIIIFLILVAIYLVYGHPIRRAIKVSKTIEENSLAYEQNPKDAVKNILVLGDSTAVGTGASKPEDSIAGRLGKDFPNATIKNISKNGLKIMELSNIIKDLPESDEKYDLLIIQIGANDITFFSSKKEIKDNLDSVLEFANENSNKTLILTSGDIGSSPVFKFPVSYIYTKRTRNIQSIFREKIKNYDSVSYVDLFTKENNDLFNNQPQKYYAKDFFHPSSDGYGVWYNSTKSHLVSQIY